MQDRTIVVGGVSLAAGLLVGLVIGLLLRPAPDRWHFDHMGSGGPLVRIDKKTGETEIMYLSGWQAPKPFPLPSLAPTSQ